MSIIEIANSFVQLNVFGWISILVTAVTLSILAVYAYQSHDRGYRDKCIDDLKKQGV